MEKSIQMGKEGMKLSSLTDDMIAYVNRSTGHPVLEEPLLTW